MEKDLPPDPADYLDPNHLGHATANPQFVDAVMHAYQSGVGSMSDERYEIYPRSQIEGTVWRRPNLFYPPKEVLDSQKHQTLQQQRYWYYVADELLVRAQEAAYPFDDRSQGIKVDTERKAILRAFIDMSVAQHKQHVYFDVDTAMPGVSSAEISQQVASFVEEVKAKVRRELGGLIQQPEIMGEIRRKVEVVLAIQAATTFKEEIGRLEYIRKENESPEEVEAFLDFARQILAVWGFTDVDVEMLPAEKHLLQMADALYIPAKKTGGRAKIQLRMTNFGTAQYLTIEEILENLSHEAIHHLFPRSSHGLEFETERFKFLKKCRIDDAQSTRISIERHANGKGYEVKVFENGAQGTAPAVVMRDLKDSSFQEAVRRLAQEEIRKSKTEKPSAPKVAAAPKAARPPAKEGSSAIESPPSRKKKKPRGFFGKLFSK